MLYLKNVEVARKYHISLGTVRNWIDAAENNKLKIELYTVSNRNYIANTAQNLKTLTELTDSNRKFRNTKAVKEIHPKDEFYTLFSQEQIYDIAVSLELHHEIPLQYNYFDGGAHSWDLYVQRLAKEEVLNGFNAAQKLLYDNRSIISSLLEPYDRVNVIDIGAGNALPAKALLENLLEIKKLGRYIALDISSEMLSIAERNIKEWFGDQVIFEGYERNINQDRFADLLLEEYVRKDSDHSINVVLHLGDTLQNMRRPEGGYQSIYDSMSKNDLLIEDAKVDSETSRQYFDFDANRIGRKLSPLNALVFDLMGIDESYYEVEYGFDQKTMQRYERIRLTVAIDIEMDFNNGTKVISINKGETILMWKVDHRNVEAIFRQKEQVGFRIRHSSLTDDAQHLLTISQIQVS